MKTDVCQILSRKILLQKQWRLFMNKCHEIILFSRNFFDASVWRSGIYIATDITYNQGHSLIKLSIKMFFQKQAQFKSKI